jgi:hypothetical protein
MTISEYTKVFGVVESKSVVKWKSSKWRIQDGGQLFKNWSDLPETCYSGVFGVTESEYDIKIPKLGYWVGQTH